MLPVILGDAELFSLPFTFPNLSNGFFLFILFTLMSELAKNVTSFTI